MSLIENIYPYNEPIILTDVIFKDFGGSIENAAKSQRAAAFVMAEYSAYVDLETFLLNTRVTGVYPPTSIIQLDHTYVNDIVMVNFLDYKDDVFYSISGSKTQYMDLWNKERGIVHLTPYCLHQCYSSCGALYNDVKVQIVYEAGLGSGTAYNPNILLALSTYSTIMLNEIIGYGNEAPGDIGVDSYSNQEYNEKRKGLKNTVYGQSPKANLAHRLLSRFRKRREVGL